MRAFRRTGRRCAASAQKVLDPDAEDGHGCRRLHQRCRSQPGGDFVRLYGRRPAEAETIVIADDLPLRSEAITQAAERRDLLAGMQDRIRIESDFVQMCVLVSPDRGLEARGPRPSARYV